MGLKKKNYVIPMYNITIPKAYARIYNIEIDIEGNARAYIAVCAAREDVGYKIPFETQELQFVTDKLSNPYTTAYETAKQGYFNEWVDDMPTDQTDPTDQTEDQSQEQEQ